MEGKRLKKAKRLKNSEKELHRKPRRVSKKANKNKTKFLKIFVILVLCVLLVCVIGYIGSNWAEEQKIEAEKQKLEEQIEENRNNLTKEREYCNMKINNIKIDEEDGKTHFSANIENTSKKDFNKKNVTISFITKENESVAKFRYHIRDIKKGEKLSLNIITDVDFTNVYDFEIDD